MGLELPSYGLTEEQLAFRDMLRRFLVETLPSERLRASFDSEAGLALDVWKEGCASFGLSGLAVDEASGGQGFGLPELAVAISECGRSLATLPLFSVGALVIPVIDAFSDPDERPQWLASLLEGEVQSVAWAEAAGDYSGRAIQTTVDGLGRLCGEKHLVLHGDAADRFFVVARNQGSEGSAGLVVVAVDATAAGVEVERLEGVDLSRRLARVRFSDVAGEIVGAPVDGGERLARVLARASALQSVERVGAMERVLESAVDFASERQQFGRPIGSFQAIKHKAADLLIDFEGARTATQAAVDALAANDPDAEELVAVAEAFSAPAFIRMATENLQIHGGVGYTWEYDPHLYFRRAHASAVLLGDAGRRYEELAKRLAMRVSR